MKKDEILVIFESYQRANWFIEDKILPLMPYLKKRENNVYESDTFIIRALSLSHEHNIRGRRADLIYLSDTCRLRQYNTILGLVNGNHDKIQVVV
jgi:hypothetical protein